MLIGHCHGVIAVRRGAIWRRHVARRDMRYAIGAMRVCGRHLGSGGVAGPCLTESRHTSKSHMRLADDTARLGRVRVSC